MNTCEGAERSKNIKILISKKICSQILEEQINNLMKKEGEVTNEEIDINAESYGESLNFLK
jgi:hypothetical protein